MRSGRSDGGLMAVEPGAPLPMAPQSLGFAGDVSPCRRHECRACCIDTEMPLLPADIERLASLTGRSVQAFSVHDDETGETRLRNVGGQCVFLGPVGCTVYAARPAGCRIYPLVYDAEREHGVLDEDCPYRTEFRVRATDRITLDDLVTSLLDDSC